MESIHIKKKGSEVMNLRLLTIGFSALVLAVFSTGCGIFESAGKSPENSFYRPKPGKNLPADPNAGGKRAPGEADFSDQSHLGNQPSSFTDGAGLDSNTYDGFGTPIAGVSFDIVYFKFDQDQIASTEMAKIDKVVAYLNSNPGTGVVIEGNCDSRGSEEYNRALGERRAIAAQQQILASGIAPHRVKTLSNGKSKLAAAGETEQAHQTNRRDEFIAVKLARP